MPDPTREALGRLICDFLSIPANAHAAGDDTRLIADAILAEFLLIPRSEIGGTEYGWRHPHPSTGNPCYHEASSDGEARRLSGKWGEAVQRPILPWTPIAEEPVQDPCTDCGYPEGRQPDCRTCHGEPIPEGGEHDAQS